MKRYKFIVLGAGPSGLSFAHAMLRSGESSLIVLEKEREAGGLCRSVDVDGSPLDFGGGHFLDVKRPEVLEFLFSFLPRSEWKEHARISTINIHGLSVGYPLEAHLWQLPADLQADYLASIARAGCVRGEPMPDTFGEWVSWKLGDRIARNYMLPYNRKLWSMELSRLGTYWLHKLPDVSYAQTVESCRSGRATGSVPAHGTFLYPIRFGYGEVWKRMGESLGEHLLPSTPVTALNVDRLVVNKGLQADVIVSTIPWPDFLDVAALPPAVRDCARQLEKTSVAIDYFPENLGTRSHWIYEPDEAIPYHRILCRHNFVEGGRGHWTESNPKRPGPGSRWRHVNEYAYPVNTVGKPGAMKVIAEWARRKGIVGLGRWGTWNHLNSDVAVAEAIALAQSFAQGREIEKEAFGGAGR